MTIIVSVSLLVYVDQAFASNQERDNSEAAYEFVLDRCVNPVDFSAGSIFENSTHYMDTIYCILYEKRMIKGPDDESAEKRVLDYLPNFLKSPIKQVSQGLAIQDIKCNKSLVLTWQIKSLDPVCITDFTYGKLLDRGLVVSSLLLSDMEITQENICNHHPDVKQVQKDCNTLSGSSLNF